MITDYLGHCQTFSPLWEVNLSLCSIDLDASICYTCDVEPVWMSQCSQLSSGIVIECHNSLVLKFVALFCSTLLCNSSKMCRLQTARLRCWTMSWQWLSVLKWQPHRWCLKCLAMPALSTWKNMVHFIFIRLLEYLHFCRLFVIAMLWFSYWLCVHDFITVASSLHLTNIQWWYLISCKFFWIFMHSPTTGNGGIMFCSHTSSWQLSVVRPLFVR